VVSSPPRRSQAERLASTNWYGTTGSMVLEVGRI
jgi:hypothetical protein